MLSPTNFSKFWPPYQNFWPPYQIFHPLPFSPNFDPPPYQRFILPIFPNFDPLPKTLANNLYLHHQFPKYLTPIPTTPTPLPFWPHTQVFWKWHRIFGNVYHDVYVRVHMCTLTYTTEYICVPWRIRPGTCMYPVIYDWVHICTLSYTSGYMCVPTLSTYGEVDPFCPTALNTILLFYFIYCTLYNFMCTHICMSNLH